MITTSGLIIAETGSITQYNTPDIYCIPTIHDDAGAYISVQLFFYKPGSTYQVGEYQWRTDLATIDAETGSGSGETAPFFNAVQKAVKTYLSALNGGITFTIV